MYYPAVVAALRATSLALTAGVGAEGDQVRAGPPALRRQAGTEGTAVTARSMMAATTAGVFPSSDTQLDETGAGAGAVAPASP